jgi:hypothetical protein
MLRSCDYVRTYASTYVRVEERKQREREREREGRRGESEGRGDDGNGAAGAAAAVAAVADVAIPSASCYFLQRFSILLSRLRHRRLIKEKEGRAETLPFADFV